MLETIALVAAPLNWADASVKPLLARKEKTKREQRGDANAIRKFPSQRFSRYQFMADSPLLRSRRNS